MEIDQFVMNIRGSANALGYSGLTPVTFHLAGLTVAQLPVNRTCHVSATAPTLYPGTDVQLWVSSELKAYKSSNWYEPDAPKWDQVTDYSNLFIDDMSSVAQANSGTGDALPLTGGTMGGPVLLFRDPVVSNEAASKAYVDNVVRLIAAGKLYIEQPVTTIAELRALDVSSVPDEQVIYVESAHRMYGYDLQGVGVDDGQYVITPNSGIGRWFSTTPNILDGGVI